MDEYPFKRHSFRRIVYDTDPELGSDRPIVYDTDPELDSDRPIVYDTDPELDRNHRIYWSQASPRLRLSVCVICRGLLWRSRWLQCVVYLSVEVLRPRPYNCLILTRHRHVDINKYPCSYIYSIKKKSRRYTALNLN